MEKTHTKIGKEVPPHNNDAETAFLGSLLIDPNALWQVMEIIEIKHFYNERHALIYETMLDLNKDNIEIDPVTIADKLQKAKKLEYIGGMAFLADIMNNTPTAANITYHAAIIAENYYRRDLIKLGKEIIDKQYNYTDVFESVNQIDNFILDLHTGLMSSAKTNEQIYSELIEVLTENYVAFKEGRPNIGMRTGLVNLDYIIGGLKPGKNYYIAGRPGMGKTQLGIHILNNLAWKGNASAFFSLEMTGQELLIWLAANHCKINSKKIEIGDVTNQEWDKISKYFDWFRKSQKIKIIETHTLTPGIINSQCKRLKRLGFKVIFIDYLQLCSARDRTIQTRNDEIGLITRSIKLAAMKYELAIVIMVQLNREVENRIGKKPQVHDLRESGNIEQDADKIIFLWRPEAYGDEYFLGIKDSQTSKDLRAAGRCGLIVGKNRGGAAPRLEIVSYEPEFGRFTSLVNIENEVPF